MSLIKDVGRQPSIPRLTQQHTPFRELGEGRALDLEVPRLLRVLTGADALFGGETPRRGRRRTPASRGREDCACEGGRWGGR